MISLQVNVKSFKEKRVVTVFGYKIQLTCSARKEGIEEEDEDYKEEDEDYEEEDEDYEEEDEDYEEEGGEVDDGEGVENDKEADEGDRKLITRAEDLSLEYLEVDLHEMIPLVPSNREPDDLKEVVISDNWDLWLKQDCR